MYILLTEPDQTTLFETLKHISNSITHRKERNSFWQSLNLKAETIKYCTFLFKDPYCK